MHSSCVEMCNELARLIAWWTSIAVWPRERSRSGFTHVSYFCCQLQRQLCSIAITIDLLFLARGRRGCPLLFSAADTLPQHDFWLFSLFHNVLVYILLKSRMILWNIRVTLNERCMTTSCRKHFFLDGYDGDFVMQYPLLATFFSLSYSEWNSFCTA